MIMLHIDIAYRNFKLKSKAEIGDGEDADEVKISYYTACCNLRAWFSGLH